jgi:GT2 family glycosyltransferase
MLDQGGAGGISAAWNMALEWCTSDVVFILNSDDWYERDCAETVLAAMNADKQVDIVVANARNYKRGEKVPCGVWRNRPAWLLPILMPYVHPACFVRKCVYDRVGGFDPEYLTAMDYDFLWRCRAGGMRFSILPDIVTNFELGGTANSCRKEARAEVYRIGRRYCRLLPMAALAARFLTGR